jgi:hypothetical protein
VESVLGSGVYGPLNYFFVALGIAAFIIEAWAFIDAIVRPTSAFIAAATMMGGTVLGRLTKTAWLIILGVAFVIGLYFAAYGGAIGFLSVRLPFGPCLRRRRGLPLGGPAQGQGVPQGRREQHPHGPVRSLVTPLRAFSGS